MDTLSIEKVTHITSMKHSCITLSILICCFLSSKLGWAQFTQNGSCGLVAVPTAEMLDNRHIALGTQVNSKEYKFYPSKYISNQLNPNGIWRSPANNEINYFVNIGYIPRVNLIINLLRDIDKEDTIRQGIGDRSFQFSYLILKEKEVLPAIKITLIDPIYSVNAYHVTNHLVATKTFNINNQLRLSTTLGYGPKKYLRLNLEEKKIELIENRTHRFNFPYLVGIFGGLELIYHDLIQFSLEHDGNKTNSALSLNLKDKLHVEVSLLGMKNIVLGAAYVFKVK